MNRYKGKIISILGDSISTFAGYIPEADGVNLAHRPRYPQDNLLTDVNDTWWMKLINTLVARLGVNDSWAGSTVSNFRDHNEKDFGPDAAMASITRIRNLGFKGAPDLIIFFGGTNDAGKMIEKGSFCGSHKLDLAARKWDSFADAYSEALLRLKHFYPEAEIVAVSPSISGGYYDNGRLSEFADLALEICLHYNIKCVDLRKSGLTFDMLPDTLHPNAEGMECIYRSVLNKLKEEN
jgi:lysophospholipase L1-like esterase